MRKLHLLLPMAESLRLGWLAAAVLILASLQILFHSQAVVAMAASGHNGLQQLNSQSQRLISELKAGTAEAVSFRTDVVYYRETLRSIMLNNNKLQREAKPLLMEMVRMAALLQSAADCQTGRYISCPADLMQRLEEQQHQLDGMLRKETGG